MLKRLPIDFSPFLKIGVILASFQHCGMAPSSIVLLKIMQIGSVMISESSRSTCSFGCMLSGPADFVILSAFRCFMAESGLIMMFSKIVSVTFLEDLRYSDPVLE